MARLTKLLPEAEDGEEKLKQLQLKLISERFEVRQLVNRAQRKTEDLLRMLLEEEVKGDRRRQ